MPNADTFIISGTPAVPKAEAFNISKRWRCQTQNDSAWQGFQNAGGAKSWNISYFHDAGSANAETFHHFHEAGGAQSWNTQHFQNAGGATSLNNHHFHEAGGAQSLNSHHFRAAGGSESDDDGGDGWLQIILFSPNYKTPLVSNLSRQKTPEFHLNII